MLGGKRWEGEYNERGDRNRDEKAMGKAWKGKKPSEGRNIGGSSTTVPTMRGEVVKVEQTYEQSKYAPCIGLETGPITTTRHYSWRYL